MRILALFALMVVALSACNETSVADVAGDWTLVSGTGPSGEIPLVDNYPIVFGVSEEDGWGGGEGPCNHYGGLILEDGNVRRDEDQGLASTAMGCLRAGVEQAEIRYYEALNDATRFTLDGDQLVLTGPDTELRFERS